MKKLLPILSLAALASTSFAQIAPGEAARFTLLAPDGSAIGIDIIDAAGAGAATTLTGLPGFLGDMTAGVLDPVTGSIWCVVNGSFRIFRVELAGNAVTSMSLLADLGGLSTDDGLSGIDVDGDGNVFVCDATHVWQVGRATGAVTLWNQSPPATLTAINNLTIDRATHTMWTVTLTPEGWAGSELREYDLTAGPSAGVQLLDVNADGTKSNLLSSVTHDGMGNVIAGSFGGGCWIFDTSTGLTQNLAFIGAHNAFNSLDWDSVNGNLHTGGGAWRNGWYSVLDVNTMTGTVINSDLFCDYNPPAGVDCKDTSTVRGVAVNDFLHTTQMFPRSASVSAGFTLEVSANGMPGDFAAIAVGEINGIALASPIVLGGYGLCGLGGNFVYSSAVPWGVLPGFLTSLGIGTATYDFASGVFSYGGVETLTLNP